MMKEAALFSKLSSKMSECINSNKIYNALVTYLWMCMFHVPFQVGLTAAVCSFLYRKWVRILVPGIFAVVYIPLNVEDVLLSGFYLCMFGIGLGLMEYRKRKNFAPEAFSSLVLLLFSVAALSILDFTQGVVWKGILNTYGFGGFPACLYRVFSLFLMVETIWVLHVFIKNTKVCSFLVFGFVFFMGTVNYWVLAITNKEFLPSDLYLAKTAATVISNVQITTADLIPFLWYLGLVVVFFLVLWEIRFPMFPRKMRVQKGLKGIIYLMLMVLVMHSGFIRTYTYKSAAFMGLPSRLVASAKGIEKPSGYEEFLKETKMSSIETADDLGNSDGPNVIVIMSEAFSDLDLVGEFETNEDYMPYIRGLMEEHPSGTLYSSVFGNNTVSSEYEFLTGVPTGLTEKGGTIYQRYIEEEEESIVSLMEKQGYYTTGLHPYDGVGYNRLHAWESYGFDAIYFQEDFEDADTLRGFIRDSSFYEKIIEVYENKPEQPLFCYGISMQNHATFLTEYEGDIRLTDMKYEDVEEYLSLLKETDEATKKLIDYFSEVDEDTMIVFYGDHQPMIDTEFYSELLGTDYYELSIEQESKIYEIPYFVWTNYEADFDVPEEMSINYLPNVMLDAAGVHKDSWFAFTDKVFKEFPVVTDQFVKVDGKFLAKEDVIERLNQMKEPDAGNEWNLLKRYQVLSFQRALEK